jgi:hypothetical protein
LTLARIEFKISSNLCINGKTILPLHHSSFPE